MGTTAPAATETTEDYDDEHFVHVNDGDANSKAKTRKNHNNQNQNNLTYMTGFNNTFESEVINEGVSYLPKGRNNPRLVPFGYYTEQLSGTAFTCPRHTNRRTWLYRKLPSVVHNAQNIFHDSGIYFGNEDPTTCSLNPNPLRWLPFTPTEGNNNADDDVEKEDNTTTKKNFITGMNLLGSCGNPETKHGLAIYVYLLNADMNNTASNNKSSSHMYNSDGDLLILPQEGSLFITTEVGRMIINVGEFCVLPRGIVFTINRHFDDDNNNDDDQYYHRGYVLEIYKGHFILPELGPIGSNGLANARDFQYPTAWIDDDNDVDEKAAILLYNKFGSKLFTKTITTTPYNAVAYHGNYLPYKYDLSKFCAVNSVSYDHLDPSIYTVLTCVGGDEPQGTALCDFVIFPPRYMATDSNTLRPPWFHRNTMTEFMGLLYGEYDAKSSGDGKNGKKGFLPGGASLHSCMIPHGPDKVSYDKAIADPCDKPIKFDKGLAFMFETSCILRLSTYALHNHCMDTEYGQCWNHF